MLYINTKLNYSLFCYIILYYAILFDVGVTVDAKNTTVSELLWRLMNFGFVKGSPVM